MKKMFSILLILMGIVSIGCGCYLVYSDNDSNTNGNNESEEQTEEVIISISDIKDFSEYKSYQINIDYSSSTYMTWKYDGNNNNMYFSILGLYYAYYDITNSAAYVSEDGSTWTLSDESGIDMTVINEISEVITLVKSGSAVDNGDNSYSLSITEEAEIDCGEATDCEVTESSTTTTDVVARFDSNGYLKSMEMTGSGISMTYTFSDVNNTTIEVIDPSTVTTADSVSDGSTSSDTSTTIAE